MELNVPHQDTPAKFPLFLLLESNKSTWIVTGNELLGKSLDSWKPVFSSKALR